MGILLGMFSLLMFVYSATGVYYVVAHDFVRHLGGANTGSDCIEVVVMLLIAVVSGGVSVRWLRGPRKA